LKRQHAMPFGATVLDGRSMRFRLWAPKAERVDLILNEGHDRLPMNRAENGWAELLTDQAGPGTLYKFRIDEGIEVPDPASRFQPHDVHGPSEVIDPGAFTWQDDAWRGARWESAVIYELHVGALTPEGTFRGVQTRLDYLRELGVTAVELMPVSDFPGRRNWGYDGVLPFAPDSSYGRPDDLKELVQAAHAKGLMMFLDVVYNHFGPEGNYLRAYAPEFFTDRHRTPWGEAINFDGRGSRAVRDYFINNALYWLSEYHFDGLRFDAVHAIADDSKPDILTEIAETVRREIPADRHVHLVLENDKNVSRYLFRPGRPRLYNAQWNDDIHHALHVIVSGEKDGYYSDYADCPVQHLGRCLAEGFDFQGQPSHYRDGERRGDFSRGLPPSDFVSFLQNHDQIGNRAFGDRILKIAEPQAVRAAMAILLLSPQPPLLFMGEDMGADTPFLFFCDFGQELAKAVTEGRRNEFARFEKFRDPAVRERIPDPNAESTFLASKLDWASVSDPAHREWIDFYAGLLRLRRERIVPLVGEIVAENVVSEVVGDRALRVHWPVRNGRGLTLLANLGSQPSSTLSFATDQVLYTTAAPDDGGQMPGWSVTWLLET